MEKINIKLPVYQQAWILADNYKEIGIRCVYNNRNRNVYLSLLNAPILASGVPGAEMTLVGIFKSFNYVRDNFQDCADTYKRMYKDVYSGNPEMLKYLEQKDTSNAI